MNGVGTDVINGSSITININIGSSTKPTTAVTHTQQSNDTLDSVNNHLSKIASATEKLVEGQKEQLENNRETIELLTELGDVKETEMPLYHDTCVSDCNPSYHTSSPNSASTPTTCSELISSDRPSIQISSNTEQEEDDGLVEKGPIIAEPPDDLNGMVCKLYATEIILHVKTVFESIINLTGGFLNR